jgi:hypothetical protein
MTQMGFVASVEQAPAVMEAPIRENQMLSSGTLRQIYNHEPGFRPY